MGGSDPSPIRTVTSSALSATSQLGAAFGLGQVERDVQERQPFQLDARELICRTVFQLSIYDAEARYLEAIIHDSSPSVRSHSVRWREGLTV